MDLIYQLHKEVTELAKKYQLRRSSELSCPGLNVSQAYALAELMECDALKMCDLAEKLNVSLGAMTKVVDSLESRGLCRRRRNKEDGRSFRVSVSPKGRQIYQGLQGEFRQHLSQSFSDLSEGQLRNLIRGVGRLNCAIESWRERLEQK